MAKTRNERRYIRRRIVVTLAVLLTMCAAPVVIALSAWRCFP